MVFENRCHVIEDPEIAMLFEQEASRGGGCRLDADEGMRVHDLLTDKEVECLGILRLYLDMQQD